jgi:hypothetical protein
MGDAAAAFFGVGSSHTAANPEGHLPGRLVMLLALMNNYNYSTYFADVKTGLYKLYAKYETKFGAARPSRTTHQSGMTSKRK